MVKSGWGRAGCGQDANPASVFWAPHTAPGEVDLVRERMGTGESHCPPPPFHADLRSKYWCLCESRDCLPLPPAPIPWPATLCCICRKPPHPLQRMEHLSDQDPPQESLGKGQQRCASLGIGVGDGADDEVVAWHGSRLHGV